MTPALTSSSLKLPISVRIFSSGPLPDSVSALPLICTITRIVGLLVYSRTELGCVLVLTGRRTKDGEIDNRRARRGAAAAVPRRLGGVNRGRGDWRGLAGIGAGRAILLQTSGLTTFAKGLS